MIDIFISVTGDCKKVYTISCLCLKDEFKSDCVKAYKSFLDDKFCIKWNGVGNSYNEKYLEFLDIFFKEKYFKSFISIPKGKETFDLNRQILEIIVEAMSNYPFQKFRIFIRPFNGINISEKIKRIFLFDDIPFCSIECMDLKDSRFMQLAGMLSGSYHYIHSSSFGSHFDLDCGKDYIARSILEKNIEPKIVLLN